MPAAPSPVATLPTSSSSSPQVARRPPDSTIASRSGSSAAALVRRSATSVAGPSAMDGYFHKAAVARLGTVVPTERPRTPLNLQQRSILAGEASAAEAAVETALDTPVDPTSAAFFDVDNTIMQGASIFHLARGLYQREFFTTRELLSAAWKQAYFRIVGVEDPEHVAEARNSALSFISGHTVKELQDLGEEIFDEAMAHRIWPGTRALAQLHLDQGQRVWLVTAAPVEIAEIIARRLGLTGAMGT